MTASVIIPTIGRPALLANALASLAACRPRADEVIVVDQSDGPETEELVQQCMLQGARRIPCDRRGIGIALNRGLRAASHEVVLITNDDCAVADDWVGVAVARLAGDPRLIVTGSVFATGDAALVPSTKTDPRPRDYTGSVEDGVLYGANMAACRSALLTIGGFDEQIIPSAEDNDLCYRWLRSGRSLRYEPAMRVWHHDWRTPRELRSLYRRYGVGQGMFYAKHLAEGDRTILRFLLRDLGGYGPAAAHALVRGRRPPDWCEGMLLGVPVGLTRGLRQFARSSA
jgi:GT2 family glycosyltransferase